MTVFKGYLKIIKQNLTYMISWIFIFLIITLMMDSFTNDAQKGIFRAESVDIAVVDLDSSTLSQGLIDYLSLHNQVTLTDGDQEKLTAALYYRTYAYVLTIPEGFGSSFPDGGETLKATKVPGSTEGYYLDTQTDSFLNQVRVYQAAGFDRPEAIEKALALSETEAPVTLKDSSGNGGEMPGYAYLFRFLPYLYISVLCYCVSYILTAFNNREIHRRMMASAISPASQNLQGIMAFLFLFMVFWGISMLLPLIAGYRSFYTGGHILLYLANSLLILAVAASIAFLVGHLIRGDNAINGITNILSLGMSFLCGVFVPLEFLSDGVKKVSQFLPVYWYETTNDLLGSHNTLSAEMQNTVFQGFLIQAAFALACFCLTLAVGKLKAQEN